MGFFSGLFVSKEALEEELKGLAKAQEAMDERFNKKKFYLKFINKRVWSSWKKEKEFKKNYLNSIKNN